MLNSEIPENRKSSKSDVPLTRISRFKQDQPFLLLSASTFKSCTQSTGNKFGLRIFSDVKWVSEIKTIRSQVRRHRDKSHYRQASIRRFKSQCSRRQLIVSAVSAQSEKAWPHTPTRLRSLYNSSVLLLIFDQRRLLNV